MASGKKHCPVIRPTPGAVGRYFRQPDDPEMVALGIENPDSSRAGAIDPALDIHLHTVGDTIFRRMHVGEQPAVAGGTIGSHVVGIDELMGADLTPLFFLLAVVVSPRVSHIKGSFVGRKN